MAASKKKTQVKKKSVTKKKSPVKKKTPTKKKNSLIQAKTGDIPNTVKDPVNGRFIKGFSGNKSGVSKDHKELISLARNMSTEALERIYAVMNDDNTPESVIVQAGKIILEQAFGKVGIRMVEDENPVEENSAEVLNDLAELFKRKSQQAQDVRDKEAA